MNKEKQTKLTLLEILGNIFIYVIGGLMILMCLGRCFQ